MTSGRRPVVKIIAESLSQHDEKHVVPTPLSVGKVRKKTKYMADNQVQELDGPAVALRCAIAEVKQRWSVIRWVAQILLSRAPPCLGRHVKPLVPAAFAVFSTHQPALGRRGGLWPFLLMCTT
jgi:hypothetical protein